jgi:ABC-type uncharacterized transport system permease subunit
MQTWNIGAEGQLYLGAVGASGVGIALQDRSPLLVIPAMVIAGLITGAAWAAIPGVLRAYTKTSEIITSLMLNYVAGLVMNYLIFDSHSYWRDLSTFTARVFPQGKYLADSANWPSFAVIGIWLPARHRAGGIAVGDLYLDALRLRSPRYRRLAAGGPLCRHQNPTEDRRRHGAFGRPRRRRWRQRDR